MPPMTPYVGPIETLTLENQNFRQVVFTGRHTQLVLMRLRPGEEIGEECHPGVDQFFRIEEGAARFVFGGKDEHMVRAGDAVVVPAGTVHNVINASPATSLRLYTLYSPPEHPGGTVQKTKVEDHHPTTV